LKQELEQLLLAAVRQLAGSVLAQLPAESLATLERTRDPKHGEFATNLALRLAKSTGKSPRELALPLRKTEELPFVAPHFTDEILRTSNYALTSLTPDDRPLWDKGFSDLAVCLSIDPEAITVQDLTTATTGD